MTASQTLLASDGLDGLRTAGQVFRKKPLYRDSRDVFLLIRLRLRVWHLTLFLRVRNLGVAELSGSGLDSRTRLQSSSGLCPSEGLTRAGGSTSRLTHMAVNGRFQTLAP